MTELRNCQILRHHRSIEVISQVSGVQENTSKQNEERSPTLKINRDNSEIAN
jgi:hypothetical protein